MDSVLLMEFLFTTVSFVEEDPVRRVSVTKNPVAVDDQVVVEDSVSCNSNQLRLHCPLHEIFNR